MFGKTWFYYQRMYIFFSNSYDRTNLITYNLFIFQADVCLIGDNCYGKGFFDVGNAGLGCIPNTDTTTWTIITR